MKGGTIVNTSGFSSLIRRFESATFRIWKTAYFKIEFIALKNDDNGVIDMTGGTITTTGAGGSAVQNWGEFTTSGGELNAPDDAKAIYASCTGITRHKKADGSHSGRSGRQWRYSGRSRHSQFRWDRASGFGDSRAATSMVILKSGTDGDVVVDGGSVSGSVVPSTNEGGTLKVSGGEFAVMPNSEIYRTPSMTAVEYTAQDGSKVCYIGTAEEVAQKLASAGAGDTVEIVQGDVALTLPEGVTVENKGEGEVVVNGENSRTGVKRL